MLIGIIGSSLRSIIGDNDFSSCPVYIREWYEAISTLSRAENRVAGPHLAADFMNGTPLEKGDKKKSRSTLRRFGERESAWLVYRNTEFSVHPVFPARINRTSRLAARVIE